MRFSISGSDGEKAILIRLEQVKISRWFKDMATVWSALTRLPTTSWMSYAAATRTLRITPFASLEPFGLKPTGRMTLDMSDGLTLGLE